MKLKRIVNLMLALGMTLSLLPSCGQKEKPSDGQNTSGQENKAASYMNETGFPITKEKVTIKAMGLKDPGGTEWQELELFKKVEELTNIHFEFELAEESTYKEKKNLALASGEYPDVFLRGDVTKDEDVYGPQGIFMNLKPLIDKYAPNLKKRMEEDRNIKAAITAIDGNIYALPYYVNTSTRNPHVSFFNTEWMKRVGMEMPKTTDDLYNLLVAFKEKDPNNNGKADEIPWSCYRFSPLNVFILPAFTGLSGGPTFDIKDDKVVFTPLLPEFKEYLAYMNKLYKEKLIDNEFLTQNAQQHLAKVKNGIVGIYNTTPTSLPEGTTDVQDSLEPITSPFNNKKVTQAYSPIYTGRGVITDKCKYPEAVMRWFDIWYAKSNEAVQGLSGTSLFVGIEGVHWEYADADKKTYKFKAPIGSFQDINKKVSVNMYLPGYLEFLPYPSDFPLMEQKVKAVQKRQEPYMKEYFPPAARYTKEESEKGTLLETDVNTYVEQMMTKFITGDEPIQNFDKYVENLKKMNIDELAKIKQTVYDRWVKSSK